MTYPENRDFPTPVSPLSSAPGFGLSWASITMFTCRNRPRLFYLVHIVLNPEP